MTNPLWESAPSAGPDTSAADKTAELPAIPETARGRFHDVVALLRDRAAYGSKPRQRDDNLWIALSIEGGGMRGTITAGMAYALHELGLTQAFDAVYGTSAGAINAAWLLSSRPDGLRGWTDPRFAQALINWGALLRGRPVVDVHTLVEEVYVSHFPMDFASVLRSPVEHHPLATDAATGMSTDLWPLIVDLPDFRLALRASAAMPFLAGEAVTLHGRRFYDGGVAESVPFRTPLLQGATHVLVLRSKPREGIVGDGTLGGFAGLDARRMPPPPRSIRLLTRTALRKESPQLRQALLNRAVTGAQDVARIMKMEAEGRAFAVFADRDVPPVSRLTTDGALLAAAFESGRQSVHSVFPSRLRRA